MTKLRIFCYSFSKKKYPETIFISHNSGNFLQSGNTDYINNRFAHVTRAGTSSRVV